MKKVEEEMRKQSISRLCFELRNDGITASRAFERCDTNYDIIVSLSLGCRILDTPAMKHNRVQENKLRKTVVRKMKKIDMCDLILYSKHSMIFGSPDGIV